MNAKILVILPTSNFLHRQILEGILDYARENGPWQFHLVTGDDFEQGISATEHWGTAGIIALLREERKVRQILRRKLPTVLINSPFSGNSGEDSALPPRTVFVNRDQEGVGRTAAEYFLERGYKSFAFIGSAKPATWSDRRLDGFKSRIASSGGTLSVYAQPSLDEQRDFIKDARRMKKYLSALPSKTAVFCARDRRAQQVLGVCLDAGIAVPHTLAVLGSDDDCLLCEATTPSLSSVALDGKQTGIMCATILNELIKGKTVNPYVDLAFPRVITRQSTDSLAIDDLVLAKALGEIRNNLQEALSIDELARRIGFSKRTLEIKALKILGRTLREEINRIRLNEAVRLLSNTNMPINEIAIACGFCCASHLGTRMKKAFGYPPSTFRFSIRQ